MKICTICKKEKEDKDFCWKYKNIRRETYCKECKAKKAKIHYKTYKSKKMELETKRKKEMRQFLLNYKAQHPCVDCGEVNPLVLEFDHINSKNKKNVLARMHGNSMEVVLKELDKCEVRCANCHAIKTAKDYYKDLIIPKYINLNKIRTAAPELLEALDELRIAVGNITEWDRFLDEPYNKAIKAIKKATE